MLSMAVVVTTTSFLPRLPCLIVTTYTLWPLSWPNSFDVIDGSELSLDCEWFVAPCILSL